MSGLNSVLTIRAAGAIIAVLPRAPLAGSFAMPVAILTPSRITTKFAWRIGSMIPTVRAICDQLGGKS